MTNNVTLGVCSWGDASQEKPWDCLSSENNWPSERKPRIMRIASPLTNGLPAAHFGRCEQVPFIDVDTSKKGILDSVQKAAPEHELGLLPRWLRGRGVPLVIERGMGSRARDLFAEAGVEVLTGAESGDPEKMADNYLNGMLVAGENSCDHRAAGTSR
jgi:predicted Fe-Mo cluster-binding NifX family protein